MVDKAKVEEAIKLLLEGIGEDVNREGLQELLNVSPACARKFMADLIMKRMNIFRNSFM